MPTTAMLHTCPARARVRPPHVQRVVRAVPSLVRTAAVTPVRLVHPQLAPLAHVVEALLRMAVALRNRITNIL